MFFPKPKSKKQEDSDVKPKPRADVIDGAAVVSRIDGVTPQHPVTCSDYRRIISDALNLANPVGNKDFIVNHSHCHVKL